MRYRVSNIDSIATLLKKLQKHIIENESSIWFRGQSNYEYKLIPGFYRYQDQKTEKYYKNLFVQSATLFVPEKVKSEFDWLFVMQHYGVPTRLLDWSESPLVALYFACSSESNTNKDGALWVILPNELNKCANINLNEEEGLPSIDHEIFRSYLPENFAQDTSLLKPAAITSGRNTSRMQAQMGTFIVYHNDQTPIENINKRKHVWKYRIPARHKAKIMKELDLIGINKFHLFPELSSIGEAVKSRFN